ncbi:MAG TPA: universal stress protein [Planctomycetota bacterium]|nr:universal stress protein [Planctomycetota bacterium]
MSIICGTDFSPLALEAADAAAIIAARFKEPLLLAHVIGEFAEFSVANRENSNDSVQVILRKRLTREAERLRQVHGLTVQEELLSGVADEVLIHLAQRTGARMIVVSHLGRRLPDRWLLGSTAERLAQTSSVPIMIVRRTQPFESWAEGNALNVFVGVDFNATTDAALAITKDLYQQGACHIIAGHIAWPPGEIERLGIKGPMDLVKLAPEAENILKKEVAAKVKRMIPLPLLVKEERSTKNVRSESPDEATPVRIQIVPGLGRTDAHLVQLANQENADLVVVGTHQRTGLSKLWHSSVSRGVLHLANTNVLIAPSRPVEAKELPIPRIANVLVTTDLSECANCAVPYAYSMLSAGSTVHLVHVTHPGFVPDSVHAYRLGGHKPTADETTRHLCHLDAQLRALVPAEAEERGIKTKVSIIEEDDIVKGICASAERLGADMVCIGSHGRTGLMKALIGSVAQGVLAHSKRPVLVIRAPGSIT